MIRQPHCLTLSAITCKQVAVTEAQANCNLLIAPCMAHLFYSRYFYSASSSLLPLRGAPDYSTDTVSQLTRQNATGMKDLPKFPMWQLEWDSNLRPSACKTLNLPLSHNAPQDATFNPLTTSCIGFLCISVHAHHLKG